MTVERVVLTIQEYADRHKVSTRTVHRWIKEGRVPVVRYTARTVRIEYVPRLAIRQIPTS
jgi:excisionase family DNA binding protein